MAHLRVFVNHHLHLPIIRDEGSFSIHATGPGYGSLQARAPAGAPLTARKCLLTQQLGACLTGEPTLLADACPGPSPSLQGELRPQVGGRYQ